MDNTPLSSLQEGISRELLTNPPLLTHPRGHHPYSAHRSCPTSALPPQHISDFPYGVQMSNAHFKDLPPLQLQDVYGSQIVAEAMVRAGFSQASLPGSIDLLEENHPSIHDIARTRTERLPQAPTLPPSAWPAFLQMSGNPPFGTVFSQAEAAGIYFDLVNPATPSSQKFLVDKSYSHNFTNTPGEHSDHGMVASTVCSAATTDDSSTNRATTSSDADFHEIERSCTASSDIVVDRSIARIPGATQKRLRCRHPGCTEPDKAWRNKHDARNHVRKHLGETELYHCKTCGKNFACEKNARRHQLNQGKKYRCKFCGNMFTRTDCRNKHQKSCGRNAKRDTIPTPVLN